jgi:hypothetical protein
MATVQITLSSKALSRLHTLVTLAIEEEFNFPSHSDKWMKDMKSVLKSLEDSKESSPNQE